MTIMKVALALIDGQPEQEIEVRGWLRTVRSKPASSFIELNDGSWLKNLQIIVAASAPEYVQSTKRVGTGASIAVSGTPRRPPGQRRRAD